MAESSENPDEKVDSPAAAVSPSGPGAQPQQAQPIQTLRIDDSKVVASYANFCRVTGTPEELILDFGLNPQPFEIPTEPIPLSQRIITNFYTAKRLLHALQLTIERHEATFGALELNVERRVRPGVLRPPQGQ